MSDYISNNIPVLARELLSLGYQDVSPWEFYQDIFPEGELGNWGDTPEERTQGEYTAIAVEITNEKKENGKTLVRRYTISNEMDNLDYILGSQNFCVMSPISYAGKSRAGKNARFMYALCIEVDGLVVSKKGEQKGLSALIQMWSERIGWLPQPTYMVCSGSGLHLYYVFERAIPLFKNVVDSLKKYKEELTYKLWNRHITELCTADKIQYESVFQGFRIPGTLTKKGEIATAFKTGEKVSIEYMNKFAKEQNHIALVYKSKLTLEKAKEKYPEWYERRIVRGDKRIKKWDYSKQKGHNGDELYNWWLRRIENEAAVGGRYYCLMALAIYALKCDIEQERLEEDCFRLMKIFDERSTEETNRFTEKDVLDALQAYEDDTLITYPVNSIANRSRLPIEKNKRNGRKQADHVKLMNYVRDEINKNENWRDGNGRPAAQEKVLMWRASNPDGTKKQCKDETGLTYPTIRKWWDTSGTFEKKLPKTLEELEEFDLDEFSLDLDAEMVEVAKSLMGDSEEE